MPKIIKDVDAKILRAAREALSEGGNYDLSIRAVSSKAGVSVGTIYNHYPDKAMLIEAVIFDDWQSVGNTIAERVSEANLEEDMGFIYDSLVAFYKDREDLYDHLFENKLINLGAIFYRCTGDLVTSIRHALRNSFKAAGKEENEGTVSAIANIVYASVNFRNMSKDEVLEAARKLL